MVSRLRRAVLALAVMVPIGILLNLLGVSDRRVLIVVCLPIFLFFYVRIRRKNGGPPGVKDADSDKERSYLRRRSGAPREES